jgi:transcriptional regulator with XRE-family HTH domain
MELRKQRGLTQVEVAAALGINPSVVSDYENDTPEPRVAGRPPR